MIKNVIFDIGNVILKFSRDYLLSHFYTGPEYEFLKEKIFCRWEDLDEDIISLDSYKKKVYDSLPTHLRDIAMSVLNYWDYFMSYSDGIISFIQELKQKGYKLYILSNMTKHFIEREYKFPILKEFDGIVYSAPIKMVKPNDDIYQYILSKYQLNPEECLFIDDTKPNLAAAAKFGIKTFHYQFNTNALREYLFSL